MDEKQLTIIPKTIMKSDISNKEDFIPKVRELIAEQEGFGDTKILRFKLGDGVTPFSELPYVQSLYNLYPNFILYNANYTQSININFNNEVK